MNPVAPGFPVSELDYDLPPELIAQIPAAQRSDSRLLVLDRRTGDLTDRFFRDLPDILGPTDLLVLNNTRVIPARFELRRATGGRIEGLFLHEREPGLWEVMLKNAGRVKIGEPLKCGMRNAECGMTRVRFTLHAAIGRGRYLIHVDPPASAVEILSLMGRPPLPPYIRRKGAADQRDALDAERYQTVYARQPGAVAAPTAGLHFTRELLDGLAGRGVEQVEVTLHVGVGTFAPVTVDDLRDHEMHAEWFEFTEEAERRINAHRAGSGRIVAVGTTSVRVLESCVDVRGAVQPASGWTSIFCYPPYPFRAVDALLTNFHLPRSTLLALVMAFAGVEPIRRAYQHAMAQRYRFYSYGDAMLIL